MKLICPECRAAITIDDSLAEKTTNCPLCQKPIQAPALMREPPIAVAPLIPNPPAAPATIVDSLPPPPPPVTRTPKSTPAETEPSVRVTFTPEFARWVGPSALVLLFLLTMFTWVGAFPGGVPVYFQSGWQTMTGGFIADIPGEEVFGREADLIKTSGFSFTMLLYLLGVIAVTMLAVVEIFDRFLTIAIPDAIQWVWQRRLPVCTAGSAVLLLLLLLQMAWGIGLENAAAAVADAKFPIPAGTAEAPATQKQKTLRDITRGRELGGLAIQRTLWFRLALLMNVVAVVGFATEYWLTQRGDQPLPRLEMWC